MTGSARSGPGRALGIDLGTRRIGIAVSDSAGTMAMPRATLSGPATPSGTGRPLVELVLEEEAVVVVVGLPLSLDGSHGRPPRRRRGRGRARSAPLLEEHGVGVELFDERLTTVSAHQALAAGGHPGRDRRAVVDQAAAAVMLTAWLETRGRAAP